MTATEWDACNDPNPIEEYLWDKISDRKVRLYWCAILWTPDAFSDKRSWKALEVAERYADGLAGEEELAAAREAAGAAVQEAAPSRKKAADLARQAVGPTDYLRSALGNWPPVDRVEPTSQRREIFRAARERACVLLRDLFGNPYRQVRLDPAWLAWEGGTVVKLARLIYDQGRYQDMPILADALEEAGCTNEDILSHCKSNNEHARGCWVLDLLLGKT